MKYLRVVIRNKYVEEGNISCVVGYDLISIHEFVRNQVVLTQHWTDHYVSMVWSFPPIRVNGAVWGVLGFAVSCRVSSDHHTEILIHGKQFSLSLAGRV